MARREFNVVQFAITISVRICSYKYARARASKEARAQQFPLSMIDF